MRLEPTYISTGANRASSSSAILSDGRLAFAADRAVAIWDPLNSNVETLAGHEANVTVIKSCKSGLISGDAAGRVNLWSISGTRVEATTSWTAHEGSSISAIASIASGSLDGHFLTAASDSRVRLWNVRDGQAEMVQEMGFQGKLPLDMEVAYLPGSAVIGLTDRRIRIYTYNASTHFTHAISLEGHEDWIRCLAITPCPSQTEASHDLLLASGSQDNFIRLWRIAAIARQNQGQSREATIPGANRPTESDEGQDKDNALDMLDEFERKLAGEGGGASTQISTKAHVLAVEGAEGIERYNVTLEALLVGHEAGLTNVHWSPVPSTPSELPQPHLLSTATDNSMILWTPSEGSHSVDGIWIPAHRFGAVGGRGLAFYGGLWGLDRETVLASGWTGGWEKWTRNSSGEWQPSAGVTGHWGTVATVEWSPNGEYLLSMSSDQTTRIHAYAKPTSSSLSRWAEIARPQIHGYDMTCAAWLGDYRFASGADEKLTRIFDAPEGFVASLKELDVEHQEVNEERPKGATVPPLGLSNRELGRVPDQPEIPTQNAAQDSVSITFTELPTEEELATTTLWPEIEKVYGHGYEIAAMAASPDHTLLATACEARNVEHAAVRLSSTTTWDSVGVPLTGHSLTVTRIAFHPSTTDGRILTTSRDRSWRIWSAPEGSPQDYSLRASMEKAHARMINDGCWWSGGFITAGRDKCVKVWRESSEKGGSYAEAHTIKLQEGATAVDAVQYENKQMLAVGLDNGALMLYEMVVDGERVEARLIEHLQPGPSHLRAVTRVAFRPDSATRGRLELASCSEDRSVRIFRISP